MQGLRKNQKAIACLVILMMSFFCTVWSPAQASLVTTGEIIYQAKSDDARHKVRLFFERADVREHLVAMGINPNIAKARVSSMTDQEIVQIADRVDQLPAGSGAFETILIIAGIVAIAFFVTDLIGWTDVYKVINKKN
jgi:hypothetical protein